MADQKSTQSTRELLIAAGLEELNKYGVGGFSTRRVAKSCGLSCAAPYRHFRDTDEFISQILTHINRLYDEELDRTLRRCEGMGTREKLVEVSLGYIRFLVEHPQFRRVIMQTVEYTGENIRALRGQLTQRTYDVVSEYCREVNMPDDVRKRKTFVVRAFIYCSALFFDNGEMQYNEEDLAIIRGLLEREFDLP